MPNPECAYCGTTEGLRQCHDGGGYIKPDFICEGCFTPQDDGPCFDDLPPAPSLPPPSPSMSSEARAANVKLQRDIIRRMNGDRT